MFNYSKVLDYEYLIYYHQQHLGCIAYWIQYGTNATILARRKIKITYYLHICKKNSNFADESKRTMFKIKMYNQ